MAKQSRKHSRKGSRRHRKQQGGDGENNVPPALPAENVTKANATATNQPNQLGGGRKSRKARRTRKLSPWNKFVQKIYKEMKSKNKAATFSQALKEASKRKKEM